MGDDDFKRLGRWIRFRRVNMVSSNDSPPFAGRSHTGVMHMLKLREMVRSCGRKVAVAGAFIGSTAVALAQETGASATDFDSFLTTLKTDVTTNVNKLWPVIASVAVIAVGLFLATVAYRKIKQWLSR